MRVIIGSAKGRKLKMPTGGKTRPAMGKVKNSLFSILAPRLKGSRFLDLFAGSGSLGIEALSRGASLAVFVDQSSACARAIRENLDLTRLTNQAQVFTMDCLRFLQSQGPDKFGGPFDIVCIDPPYLKGLLQPIMQIIPVCPLFNHRTIFIMEREKKDDPGLAAQPSLDCFDERNYGATILTFLRLRPPPETPSESAPPPPAPPPQGTPAPTDTPPEDIG